MSASTLHVATKRIAALEAENVRLRAELDAMQETHRIQDDALLKVNKAWQGLRAERETLAAHVRDMERATTLAASWMKDDTPKDVHTRISRAIIGRAALSSPTCTCGHGKKEHGYRNDLMSPPNITHPCDWHEGTRKIKAWCDCKNYAPALSSLPTIADSIAQGVKELREGKTRPWAEIKEEAGLSSFPRQETETCVACAAIHVLHTGPAFPERTEPQ